MEDLTEGKQQYETAKSQESANNKIPSSVVLDMLIQLSDNSENLDEATKAELSSIIGRFSILSTQLDEAAELQNINENPETAPRPEGYLSIDELSESLEVSKSLIQYAIKLSEGYGEETNNSQLSTESIEFLSPDQQKLVERVIKSEIWVPEGYITANGIASLMQINSIVVYAAVKRLKNEGLIDPISRFLNNRKTVLFSPKEQMIIENGIESYARAPEGYITRSEFSHRLNTSSSNFEKIVNKIPEEILGPVKKYKNNKNGSAAGRPACFYSPKQQAIITTYFSVKQK